jgi:hypothetical protein
MSRYPDKRYPNDPAPPPAIDTEKELNETE